MSLDDAIEQFAPAIEDVQFWLSMGLIVLGILLIAGWLLRRRKGEPDKAPWFGVMSFAALLAGLISSTSSASTMYGILEGSNGIIQVVMTVAFGFLVLLAMVASAKGYTTLALLIFLPSTITSATTFGVSLLWAEEGRARVEQVDLQGREASVSTQDEAIREIRSRLSTLDAQIRCEEVGGTCPDGSVVRDPGQGPKWQRLLDTRAEVREELADAEQRLDELRVDVQDARDVTQNSSFVTVVWASIGQIVDLFRWDMDTFKVVSGLYLAALYDYVASFMGAENRAWHRARARGDRKRFGIRNGLRYWWNRLLYGDYVTIIEGDLTVSPTRSKGGSAVAHGSAEAVPDATNTLLQDPSVSRDNPSYTTETFVVAADGTPSAVPVDNAVDSVPTSISGDIGIDQHQVTDEDKDTPSTSEEPVESESAPLEGSSDVRVDTDVPVSYSTDLKNQPEAPSSLSQRTASGEPLQLAAKAAAIINGLSEEERKIQAGPRALMQTAHSLRREGLAENHSDALKFAHLGRQLVGAHRR